MKTDNKSTAKVDERSSNSIIGALSAACRTFIYRLTTFYLRTPLKLFRPPRFDYLHYIRITYSREIVPAEAKFYHKSSIHLLTHALNDYGWKVIPDRILPPLIVNSLTGIVLYTTYLQTLWVLNGDRSKHDPEYYNNVGKAGFIAGAAQALVSTPIDAIFARQNTEELVSQMMKHDSLWTYGRAKWRKIGLLGCYGGFLLSFIKESFGFAAYFWAFEYFKDKYKDNFPDSKYMKRTIVFVSGVIAAILLQLIQYPFNKIEKIHQKRLEVIDVSARATNQHTLTAAQRWKYQHLHLYRNAYKDTFRHLRQIHGGRNLKFARWLYKGFLRNTATVIPATTAGLLFLNYLRTQMETTENHGQHKLQ